MGELWGWEKYGAWVEGDYFPPEEGWSSFDVMVQGLRPQKLKLLPSALFLDTSTALYKSGTMSSSAILDQQGTQRTTPSAGANGGQWAYMDISTDPWRQTIVNVYQTLAQHGADLIQLDSSMEAGPQPCYNPAHAHPPGVGGNWQTLAWTDITQRIATAVGAANPDATLSAEEPGEIYLPYLSLHSGSAVDQFQDQSQLNTTHQEPVPLFPVCLSRLNPVSGLVWSAGWGWLLLPARPSTGFDLGADRELSNPRRLHLTVGALG